jgi:hypothetical protein
VRESAQLELLKVSDEAFTASLPDGSQVYEAGRIRLEKGGSPTPTVCTTAILLAGSKATPALVSRARRMRGLRQVGNASD